MDRFLEYFFLGLSTGAIYASLALAIVILTKPMRHPNVAQGQMAMFSTYIAWVLINAGLPYWFAFLATLVISFFIGMIIERIIFRPLEQASIPNQFILLIGLFLFLRGTAGWIFGYDTRAFPAAFPSNVPFLTSHYISANQALILGIVTLLLISTGLFFKFTKLGLALRAIAQNPLSSTLVGINISAMLMLSWGISAAIGAISGMLIAPTIFLDPPMMDGVFIYAISGSILGGITSPVGVVVGGIMIGLINAILINYLNLINGELDTTATLFIMIAIILFKPTGLFTKKITIRV